jgi:hypothetical protein
MFGANKFGLRQQWMAGFCLLIMLFASSAEAAHLHALGSTAVKAAPCVLCISAHSTAPATPVLTLPTLLVVESVSAPFLERVPYEAFRLALFIRPPPMPVL